MKKLILILITGLFLSNTSYAATISELLGSKKGIQLNCLMTPEHDDSEEAKFNSFYEIKGDKFYSGGDLRDSPAEITDTYIIHNMKPTAKNKHFWHKIKINRKTGHIDQEWGQGNDLRVYNTGVCEKASENKF